MDGQRITPLLKDRYDSEIAEYALEQLRTESESLRYERDAVKKRLVDAESAAPPPQDGETTVDIWLQQLDAIWEKVPPEAQSVFLTKYGAAS